MAQYTAIGFTEKLGGSVVCVSYFDLKDKQAYTISKEDGVDARFLQSITDQYGSIDKARAQAAGYILEDKDAWLKKDVDILVPAALEGQINAESVQWINERVRIIAEGANGPTTPEADKVIQEKGIFMIPDFLCNCGGVTVSYFEAVQNDMNFYWEKDDVLHKEDQKLTKAFHDVLEMSLKQKVPMRDAAYMVAIARVVKAMQLRGWI